MAKATLTINSRNYAAWSLRSWLLCKMAGLDFDVVTAGGDDPATRAELLLLSPSFLVPCLDQDGIRIWDTMAIADHLQEVLPDAQLLPADSVARAQCRSICGEMHSGSFNLRSALPMNIRRKHSEFKVYSGALEDIDRVLTIWRACHEEIRRPLALRQAAEHGRRDVRAGVLAVLDLRRRSRPHLRRVRQEGARKPADEGVDRGGEGRAGDVRRAGDGVLTSASGAGQSFCRMKLRTSG
jgi:glutathione S-transferase